MPKNEIGEAGPTGGPSSSKQQKTHAFGTFQLIMWYSKINFHTLSAM